MKIEIKKEHLEIGAAVAAIAGFFGVIGKALHDAKKAKETAEAAFDQAKEIRRTVNDISGSVDKSIDKLANEAIVDIPEHIMQAAVEKAASDAARKMAADTAKEIKRDIRTRMYNDIDDAVTEMKTRVDVELFGEYKKRVMNSINVNSLRNTITNSVKEDIRKRVQADLDNVSSAYANQLNQQAAVLKAVNEKLSVVG